MSFVVYRKLKDIFSRPKVKKEQAENPEKSKRYY